MLTSWCNYCSCFIKRKGYARAHVHAGRTASGACPPCVLPEKVSACASLACVRACVRTCTYVQVRMRACVAGWVRVSHRGAVLLVAIAKVTQTAVARYALVTDSPAFAAESLAAAFLAFASAFSFSSNAMFSSRLCGIVCPVGLETLPCHTPFHVTPCGIHVQKHFTIIIIIRN